MSRHSGHSRHRSHQSRDTNTEEVVEQVKSVVTQLNDVMATCPGEWQAYEPSARSAMSALDSLRFFRDPQRYAEQAWILHGLQNFSFHNPDIGCIEDVADWCEASWLRARRNHPENVEVLTGLGHNWLQRSQATLTKIQREEGSSSSSSGSGGHAGSPSADRRKLGASYVEARGYLQPSADFYNRAVRAAETQGILTGELLASAAEAQMSLGNVTASPVDECHFSEAIAFLRRTQTIPGYVLSNYFQQYLDDYGRYVH